MRNKICTLLAAALAVAIFAAPAFSQGILKKSVKGDPNIKSINAIAFGPGGALLIADGAANQVVVVDTKDTSPSKWTNTKVADIRKELAGRLGTTPKGIEISKIAVNPASQKVYIAVKNLGAGKSMLITMDGAGKIQPLALDDVTYARISLAKASTPPQNITDIVFAEDRILVSAQAGGAFRSKLYSITVPVQHESKTAVHNVETYHVAHRRWETRSPIYTMIPYREKGEQYVVGAFTCTPVVKFRVTDILPEAKVKGQSVIEVGSGNRPRDMFVYEKGKKKYILMSTYRFHHSRRPVGPSPYWVVKIDYNLLAERQAVNEKALVRVNSKYENITKRAGVVEGFHGVMHMDKLDNGRAVVIRTTKDGQQDLEVLALP